jgi:hypothetical protein
MRTTLNIDDVLLRRAATLTGVKRKTALVRMGLEALIARESAPRLARLSSTGKRLLPIRQRLAERTPVKPRISPAKAVRAERERR